MESRKKRSLLSRLTLTRRLTVCLLALVILGTAVLAVKGTPLPAAFEKLAAVWQVRLEAKQRARAEKEAEAAAEAARSSLGSPFGGAYPPAREAQDILVLDIQTQQQIEDLFDRLMNPEHQSFEEYSRLFYQVSEEEIRRYYNGELAAEYRPYTEKTVAGSRDLGDCHYIEVNVSSPSRSIRVFSFCARYSGGRFYFTHADTHDLVMTGVVKERSDMKTLGGPYIRFLAAQAVGRNAVEEIIPGWLPKRLATNHWACSPAYAWQQDDGAVIMGIWIINSTYENMHLQQATVSMEDGEETVFRYTCSLDEGVPMNECRLIEVVIPAEEVLTGLEPWSGDVSCDCTMK